MTEIVVILVIALLIFGPNKLPELARSLGKGFGEFRRASYDLRQSLMEATEPDPPPHSRHARAPEAAPPPKAESEPGAAQSKNTPTPEGASAPRADQTGAPAPDPDASPKNG